MAGAWLSEALHEIPGADTEKAVNKHLLKALMDSGDSWLVLESLPYLPANDPAA